MTTYQVTAWCSVPHYTTFDVDAGNLGEALEKARAQAKDEYGEPCDGAKCDWDEFEIVSEGDAADYIRRLEPPRLAELAAPELLEQLRAGIERAQCVLDAWDHGSLAATVRALAQWIGEARATLDQATKGDSSGI